MKKKVLWALGLIFLLAIIITGRDYKMGPEGLAKGEERLVKAEMTSQDYVDDFQYFYDTFKAYYPYLEVNKELKNVDWLALYPDYLKKVEACKSDREFKKILGDYIYQLYNWHTNVIEGKESVLGYYGVYRTAVEPGDWRYSMVDMMKTKAVKARYGLTDSALENAAKVSDYSFSGPEEGQNIRFSSLANGQIGYIEIFSMASIRDSQKFREEEAALEDFLKEAKDYKALIFDIRGNTGGDSSYWADFILPRFYKEKVLAKAYTFTKEGPMFETMAQQEGMRAFTMGEFAHFPEETQRIIEDFDKVSTFNMEIIPKDSINFQGNMYLLVDGKVYSSAEMMAVFAKESKTMTLIGSTTAGDGLGSDPYLFALPKSGIIIRFAKDLGVTGKGSINEKDHTQPDIKVNPRKTGKEESDPCIKEVMKLEGLM